MERISKILIVSLFIVFLSTGMSYAGSLPNFVTRSYKSANDKVRSTVSSIQNGSRPTFKSIQSRISSIRGSIKGPAQHAILSPTTRTGYKAGRGQISIPVRKTLNKIGNFFTKTVYQGRILPAGRIIGRYWVAPIAASKAMDRRDWNEVIAASNFYIKEAGFLNKMLPGDNKEQLATIYTYRAKAYMEKGDYSQSILDNSQAIKINPNDAAIAYQNRGAAYLGKKDYSNSLADLEKATSLGAKINPVYIEQIRRAAGR